MVKGKRCECGRREGVDAFGSDGRGVVQRCRDQQRGTAQVRDTAAIAADLDDAHDKRSDRIAHVTMTVTVL